MKYRTKQKKAPSVENIAERTRNKKVRIGQILHDMQLRLYQGIVVEALADLGDMEATSTSVWVLSERAEKDAVVSIYLPTISKLDSYAPRGLYCIEAESGISKNFNHKRMRQCASEIQFHHFFDRKIFPPSDGLFLTHLPLRPFSFFLIPLTLVLASRG